MFKQSSHSSKFNFPKLSGDKRITTPKNNFKKFNFDINNKFIQKNTFCKKHQEPFIKYCQNCNTDLCEYCVFTHDNNHILIKYSDIIPDENEINLLKQTLKIFHENYTKLLYEIKNWEKNLQEKISFFEKEIENNELLNNINFINDFTKHEINFKNIFKFRKIFTMVLGGGTGVESRKNNNIMDTIDIYNEIDKSEFNMSYYNYTQYNLSKALLDLLINNNINIDNSFIYKGNLIIKYIWDSYININKSNPNKKIIKTNKPKKYDTSTYCGSLRYDKDEDIFFNDNISRNLSNKAKIIEKHIDLKKGSKKNIRKLNSNLYSNNTFDINNSNNNNNIFNKTMSTSFSSKNLLINNFGNSNGIYLKKKCNLSSANIIKNWNNKLNQTSYDISKQLKIDNYDENTKLNDSGINSDLNNKKMKAFRRTNSFNNTNKNNFNTPKSVNNNLTFNSDNQKDIITSKYIPEIRVKNLIYNKNTLNVNIDNNKYATEYFQHSINHKNLMNINHNKDKTFIHKKFAPQINSNKKDNNTKDKEEDNKLNQTQLYNKLNDTSIQEDPLNNSNILNTTYSQSHSNNYFALNNNIIISQKKQESNSNIQFISNNNPQNIIDTAIKSTIFKQKATKTLNNNNNIVTQKFQIRKCNPDTKYIINPNIPLCLSLELDNNDCKICLINQLNQEIDIFCFSQEQYSIPMIVSFDEKNEIIIGNEADKLSTINPKKTIFNLMKLIGKNYDEILGMKEIWPFKIYKDDKNRPIFWINFDKIEKKFYPEDLLSFYLKKLFNFFFKKISCEENFENNIIDINLILIVCVPNNFTYIQRKIIEKIFEKQIFPSNNGKNMNMINNNNILYNNSNHETKLYNNYHINLNHIKIENISSIAALCLKPVENKIKNNKIKPSYSLIINIGGTQTNISVAYYPSYKNKDISKNKNFGIKSASGIELGAQDFTDTFVSDCLKEFDKNLYKQCLETPSALSKLRRSCNTAEKIFEEDSHVEIKVNKLYDTYDLKMILNKSDYEKVCDNLYKTIMSEVKKTIKEAKLSEINIDHVLLMGKISRCDKIKNLLKNMFKHNRLVYNKLSEKNNISEINNDFYSVIGGAIQARNYLWERDNFIEVKDISLLNDITPMSFGVETINGMMEFVVEKGTNLPVEKNKYIKIKNDGEKCLEIKIYEGEDNKVFNNRLISSANIDKRNFKFEKTGNNYIEILLQFAISSDLNLCVYVLDIKTMKKRFECLINIDLKKS